MYVEADIEEKKPRHSVGIVSLRRGLGQDEIRAWERLYGALAAQRTDIDRRLRQLCSF